MELRISRSCPACIVFAVDRSGSMAQRTKGDGNTALGDTAAGLVNAAIRELAFMSAVEPGSCGHYFDIGVFGYGYAPEVGVVSVRSILPGHLARLPLCDLPTLAENPLRFDEQEANGNTTVPVWLDPSYAGRTPMCRAFDKIGGHLLKWVATHPNSAPPVVVNISDGLVTDSPYEGTSLEGWLDRLSMIHTTAGAVKVFDIALSAEAEHPVVRPATVGALTLPGWTVVQVAKIVPDVQVSTWASLPAISLGSDYVAPEFIRKAELADDVASEPAASQRG